MSENGQVAVTELAFPATPGGPPGVEVLGFPEGTLFTRFFRRRTGETPTAFRRRATGART